MESSETDIKPIVPASDIPANYLKSSPTVACVDKLKHSRYEDVWPEDVHAAFMEAVALYPPMGKRRLKYYRVSTHENEHFPDTNRTKSFGRCQLIQSYILEKTGKNRSRKQVSSHLQRLKKIHKDNPTMQRLFSERARPPPDCSVPKAVSSQDILATIPVDTRHPESDLGPIANLQNTDAGAVSPSTSAYASEASSFDSGSCDALGASTNFHGHPSFSSYQEFLSSIPQHHPAGALYHSEGAYLSELQDTLLFKDTANEGFRSGSTFSAYTPAFSTSTRRLNSKLSMHGRLVDSGLTMHFSRAIHSPGLQPPHQWISHDSLMGGVTYNPPLTSAQEILHTPFHPLQLIPPENRLYSSLTTDWMWPKYHESPLGPREVSFDEIRLRYPPAMHQYNPTCPEMRVNTPGSHSPPSKSELRFPSEISYPYMAASPATMSDGVTCEGTSDFRRESPGPSENLAPPPVIKPTPVYPISYIHSDLHSNIHSDDCLPARSLPP